MNFPHLRFRGDTADNYDFARKTNPQLANVYTRVLTQIDDGTITEDGNREIKGVLFRFVWVDLPGADEPAHVVIWKRNDGGTADITYLGTR